MTLALDALSLLLLLGAAQGIFLSLALATTRHGDRRANRYLAALTAIFSSVLIGASVDSPLLRLLLWPKEFWYGPLILFYVLSLTRPEAAQIGGRRWLHWLPGLLHVILSWSLFALGEARIDSILQPASPAAGLDSTLALLFNDIEPSAALLHIGSYLLLALRELQRHSRHIHDTFSFEERVSLNWLKLLLAGLFLLYSLYLFEVLFAALFDLGDQMDQALDLGIVLLIYSMGYLGLRQPVIFSRRPAVPEATASEASEPPPAEPEIAEDKYQRSALTAELSAALLAELRALMDEQRPWLDNRLTQPQLAERLGVSANYLSQAINQQQGQNFFDFVNGYRVTEAQRRLAEHADENVLTVALESGFNSKSAFYTAFRKHAGMTPSQYRSSLAEA